MQLFLIIVISDKLVITDLIECADRLTLTTVSNFYKLSKNNKKILAVRRYFLIV